VPLSIGVSHFAGVRLPVIGEYLNAFSAGSLIVSGLFLIGLVVYARLKGGIGDKKGQRSAEHGPSLHGSAEQPG